MMQPRRLVHLAMMGDATLFQDLAAGYDVLDLSKRQPSVHICARVQAQRLMHVLNELVVR